MDKKHIHIDDLSRQLLSQREEETRPGAWLTMRELLDKELPLGAPLPGAGWGWNRTLFAALILLLISAASLGGYHAFNGSATMHLANNQMAGAATSLANTTISGTDRSAANTASSQAAYAAALPVNANKMAAIQPDQNPAPENKPRHPRQVVVPVAQNQSHTAANQLDNSNKIAVNSQETALIAPAYNGTETASLFTMPFLKNNNLLTNNNTSALLSGNRLPAGMLIPATEKSIQAAAAAPASNLRDNSESFASAKPATENNLTKNKPSVPKKAGKPNGLKLIRDTIQQIQVVQRVVPDKTNRTMLRRMDTISITDVVEERWVSAGPDFRGIGPMPLGSATQAEQPIIPAASLHTEDGAGSYVSLSAQQVSSKKVSMHGISLRDKMQQAFFLMSQIQTYSGLVAGFNISPFNEPATYGFHLGLSQVFQLSPQWSVSAEVKYNRRMGSGMVLHDNYVERSGLNSSQQGPEKTYTWNQDTVDHFFKIPALQTVEVPVSIQRHMNRVFLMGGLHFSYSPRINTEEISHSRNQPVQQSYTTATNQLPPAYTEGLPSVKIDDFGSRLSVGYQLGAGYEVSPAVRLDVRFSQQFWDNAKTPGSKKVSTEFYRLPNLQLSVGYRFGKLK